MRNGPQAIWSWAFARVPSDNVDCAISLCDHDEAISQQTFTAHSIRKHNLSELPYTLRRYVLAPPQALQSHRLDDADIMARVRNWTPDPTAPLVEALPEPWDDLYRQEFRQDFQPVKFWRNASIIAHFLEGAPERDRAEAARRIMRSLLEQLERFTVRDNDRAWVENRFDFVQQGVEIRSGWVSGLANAFAIFGLRRLMDIAEDPADLASRIRAYSRAFFTIQLEDGPVLPRWSSYVTRERHLWFEEYPMAEARANLVLNGHIFVMLALNEARALWGQDGLSVPIRGGAHALAENLDSFRRVGKPNLYSLRGPRKSDYLPERAVRQMFEMFLLTGDDRLWMNGVRGANDCAGHVDAARMGSTLQYGMKLVRRRRRFEERLLRRELDLPEEPYFPPVETICAPRVSTSQRINGMLRRSLSWAKGRSSG